MVSPLILLGQSPYMILASHPELGISVKTLYNYIDMGLILTRNANLKQRVKFMKRKCYSTQNTNRKIFVGRTYQDFWESHSNEMEFLEMNTVLQMFLPKSSIFENLTQWNILKCVNHINNTPRKKLDGHAPYELALLAPDPDVLKKCSSGILNLTR